MRFSQNSFEVNQLLFLWKIIICDIGYVDCQRLFVCVCVCLFVNEGFVDTSMCYICVYLCSKSEKIQLDP